jgi:hypothetical protein
VGKEIKEHPNTKSQKEKDNIKDKRKAKVGDGQQTTAIGDIKGWNQTMTILFAAPIPKTRTKSKAKENGKNTAKENQTVRKVKEKDEVKENRDSGMNVPRRP